MSRRQPDGSHTKYSRGATAEAPVTDQDRARKAAIDYLTSEALEPYGGRNLSLEAAGLQERLPQPHEGGKGGDMGLRCVFNLVLKSGVSGALLPENIMFPERVVHQLALSNKE